MKIPTMVETVLQTKMKINHNSKLTQSVTTYNITIKVESVQIEKPSEPGKRTPLTSITFVVDLVLTTSANAKTSFFPHDVGRQTPRWMVRGYKGIECIFTFCWQISSLNCLHLVWWKFLWKQLSGLHIEGGKEDLSVSFESSERAHSWNSDRY